MSNIKVVKGEKVHMPTIWGDFFMIPFHNEDDGKDCFVVGKGNVLNSVNIPIVRIHSSCSSGDILGSLRCDCGEQLHKALELIEQKGEGLLIYLNQEGRGIGLMDKMKAYKLQEKGVDTVDANLQIGHSVDERDYTIGAAILKLLGISEIDLLTNNLLKSQDLIRNGINIRKIIPLETTPNKYNKFYLETKKKRMGHLLHLSKSNI